MHQKSQKRKPMLSASAYQRREKKNITTKKIIKFYDTCSLLIAGESLFENNERFVISSITLKELEKIKTSSNKDADIKYSTRLLIKLLEDNSDLYEVRKFLLDNNFKIEAEEIVYDYKYYQIIVASYSNKEVNYTDIELKYGPILLRNIDSNFTQYYSEKLKLFEREYQHVTDTNAKEKLSNKIEEIK